MDAPDLDAWIEAQQPPVYEQMQQVSAGDRALPVHVGEGNTLRPADTDSSESGSDDSISDGGSGKGQLGINNMRLRAIHEAAVSYAAQTALAWRYEQLRELTKSHEDTLDVIASFSTFIEDEHMLLPSITRVEDRFDVSGDGKQLRETSVQYQVSEEPRAVTQPPTWRDYIWREFSYPDTPHPALLPDSAKERRVWQEGIEQGWESGLRQAHNSWTNNLNTLVRDIRGRITYRILEARNIVRAPEMHAGQPRLTTADGGDTINAGEVVHTITVPMDFNSESEWGALWIPSSKETPEFLETDDRRLEGNAPNFEEVTPDES